MRFPTLCGVVPKFLKVVSINNGQSTGRVGPVDG